MSGAVVGALRGAGAVPGSGAPGSAGPAGWTCTRPRRPGPGHARGARPRPGPAARPRGGVRGHRGRGGL
ncbi:hypothetical protein NKH77_47790 [Streptomyces sp. M19]